LRLWYRPSVRKYRLFALVFLSCLWLATSAACGGQTAETTQADRIPRQRSVDRYVAMLESEGRAEWQKPDELVAALSLSPGQAVADVGSGSGYFLPQLSAAVAPDGRIVAQDIDEDLVEVLRARIEREGMQGVEARLGRHDDPGLEEGMYDLILMVDVYHHVADPAGFLAHIVSALAPGGRFVVVDFIPGDVVPVPISGLEHRIAKERVLADAEAAGLVLLREHDFLPYQFFVELSRPPE
jgi:2-polyprenyl-3-methyl-5-hydroxy-6-metoxy-1,4-benzoquinol methylase